MNRQKVESSQIVSVGYDADTKVLEIEFKGGSVYQYFDVPSERYTEMLTAESVGKYFGKFIKGVYRYEKQEKKETTTQEQVTP